MKPPFKLFISGKPGAGKTTLLMSLVNEINKNKDVCGFLTQEIREKGVRVGFEALNIKTQEKGILAHINCSSSIRVGKYKVDLEGFEEFLKTLEKELNDTTMIFLDEIGPMELKSSKFRTLIPEFLKKNFIIIIHRNLIEEYSRKFPNVFVYTLTEQNREEIFGKIKKDLKYFLLDF